MQMVDPIGVSSVAWFLCELPKIIVKRIQIRHGVFFAVSINMPEVTVKPFCHTGILRKVSHPPL